MNGTEESHAEQEGLSNQLAERTDPGIQHGEENVVRRSLWPPPQNLRQELVLEVQQQVLAMFTQKKHLKTKTKNIQNNTHKNKSWNLYYTPNHLS